MEKIKDIKGYEGLYKVTSWGNVYSCKKGRTITPEKTKKGYLRVKLRKDGKITNYKVHRLVAEAFIENKHKLPQVNHIDGNKANNSVTNLEWVTDKENKEHRKLMIRWTL